MGCEKIRIPGGLLHSYGVDLTGTFYNHVLVNAPNEFSLEQTEAEFAKRKLPFSVKIPKLRLYENIENSLQKAGYTLVPVWNLMVLEGKPTGLRNVDLKIERANAIEFSEWIAVSNQDNLASRRHLTQQMVRKVAEREGVHLLLAKLDNRPVGRGLLYSKDEIASIHMMSVVPEFRRKHVATTIVLDALARLKEERVNLKWLRTRKGGIGAKVYLQLGFTPAVDILTYTMTPGLDQAMTG